MTPARLIPLILALLVGLCGNAHAAGGGSKEETPDGVQYVNIDPAILVNYGGPGRLKYLKLEMAARLPNKAAAEVVKYHMPLLRSHLILLFSKQTEESVATMESKEQLRQAALEEIRKTLTAEEGKQEVEDLLFNNFIVQR